MYLVNTCSFPRSPKIIPASSLREVIKLSSARPGNFFLLCLAAPVLKHFKLRDCLHPNRHLVLRHMDSRRVVILHAIKSFSASGFSPSYFLITTDCILLSLLKCSFYSSKLYSDINPIIWTLPRAHHFSPRFTNTPNFIIHFQNGIFSWLSCSFNVLWIRFPLLKHSERRTNFTVGKNWRKMKSVTKEIPSFSAHLSRYVNWDATDRHVRSVLQSAQHRSQSLGGDKHGVKILNYGVFLFTDENVNWGFLRPALLNQ